MAAIGIVLLSVALKSLAFSFVDGAWYGMTRGLATAQNRDAVIRALTY